MSRVKILGRFIANYASIEGRPLPSFLIIGAQKAGTSSLFYYVAKHSRVVASEIKEVQFFTRRYHWGVRAYRAFFPRLEKGLLNEPFQVGEATPYYLFSQEVPGRVRDLLPSVKLVTLLREPVARAYSHYKHCVRRGMESRPFEEAFQEDIRKFNREGSIDKQPDESEFEYRHHSYVRRGLYLTQLQRWWACFGREQLMIARAEDFFADPGAVTSSVVEFLGLPRESIETGTAHNQFSYTKRPKDEFPELVRFYREANEKLDAATGIRW